MTTEGPNAEFASERRRELLTTLKEKIKSFMPLGVPSILWAGLWLADLERLESIVSTIEQEQSQIAVIGNYEFIVKKWCQKRGLDSRSGSRSGSKPSSPSLRPSPNQQLSQLHRPAVEKHTRSRIESAEGTANQSTSEPVTPPAKRQRRDSDNQSKATAMRCRFRDGHRCVVTKSLHPVDAAHIFPYSLQDSWKPNDSNSYFWVLLKYFWTKDRIDAWMNAIFSEDTTEVVENLITFAPTIHRWHSKALFGLQPIHQSEDKKCLTVKFYWFPQRQPTKNVNLLDTPSIPDDLAGINMDYKAWDVCTEEKIVSGAELVLKTNDPENFPLPSWDLLDMQWTLQRLSALSGAADVFLDAIDDDDSSGIGWEEDLSCGQSDDDSIRFHDDIVSSDQDVEPLSLSPQALKVGKMMDVPIDTSIHNQSLA
ncbi:hypothetical protein MauCBS54593_005817 [Microsporum audouinii]